MSSPAAVRSYPATSRPGTRAGQTAVNAHEQITVPAAKIRPELTNNPGQKWDLAPIS